MDVSSINPNAILGTYGLNAGSLPGNLEEAIQRLIKDKDKDGNGTLSPAEIEISEEAFALADANKDGKLNADEIKDSADVIGKELAAGETAPSPHSILAFAWIGSKDTTKTALDQIA